MEFTENTENKEKVVKYPELVAEMARRGHNQNTLATLLQLSESSISRRLSGEIPWTIEEVEIVCNFYNKDYYELFT